MVAILGETVTRQRSNKGGADVGTSTLTLDDFVSMLPSLLQQKEGQIQRKKDDMLNLLSRVDLPESEWSKYAHADLSKKYTRNLISTDDESYTLLLLVWNANVESPIHDHPCDGCWMKVLEGDVTEARFKLRSSSDDETGDNDTAYSDSNLDNLVCTHNEAYSMDQIAYVNDSIGLHKVCNPSKTERAVTLHLYSPPFQSCKLWTNNSGKGCDDEAEEGGTFKCCTGKVCMYSVGGVICEN